MSPARDDRPRWWCPLPGLEGSYDGELEAFADGPVFELVLTTHNPNHGGASGLGSWTERCLRAAEPLDGYPDAVAALRSWAARQAAEAPRGSAEAERVVAEPVEDALVAMVAAVRAADPVAATAAFRRAPAALQNLLPGPVWVACRGQGPWAAAFREGAGVEAALARWRATPA